MLRHSIYTKYNSRRIDWYQNYWSIFLESSIYITLMEKLFSPTLFIFPAGKRTRTDEKSIEQTTSLPCNKNLAIIKIENAMIKIKKIFWVFVELKEWDLQIKKAAKYRVHAAHNSAVFCWDILGAQRMSAGESQKIFAQHVKLFTKSINFNDKYRYCKFAWDMLETSFGTGKVDGCCAFTLPIHTAAYLWKNFKNYACSYFLHTQVSLCCNNWLLR